MCVFMCRNLSHRLPKWQRSSLADQRSPGSGPVPHTRVAHVLRQVHRVFQPWITGSRGREDTDSFPLHTYRNLSPCRERGAGTGRVSTLELKAIESCMQTVGPFPF